MADEAGEKPKAQKPKAQKPKKERSKLRRGLAWTFKPMVDVKAWLCINAVKDNTRIVSSLAKAVFTPAKAKQNETFEQAVQRLNLTEDVLQERVKNFSRLALFYVVVAVGFLFYAVYLAIFGSFGSFLLALVVCCLVLTQAFRFHFWIFQIQHRKLGCGIDEWYHSKIMDNKNNE